MTLKNRRVRFRFATQHRRRQLNQQQQSIIDTNKWDSLSPGEKTSATRLKTTVHINALYPSGARNPVKVKSSKLLDLSSNIRTLRLETPRKTRRTAIGLKNGMIKRTPALTTTKALLTKCDNAEKYLLMNIHTRRSIY
ncbi:unnamed protein product [Absidia cylindrospora]